MAKSQHRVLKATNGLRECDNSVCQKHYTISVLVRGDNLLILSDGNQGNRSLVATSADTVYENGSVFYMPIIHC